MTASTFVVRLSRSTQRDKDGDVRVRVYLPGDDLLFEGKAGQPLVDLFGKETEAHLRVSLANDRLSFAIVGAASADEYDAASLAAVVRDAADGDPGESNEPATCRLCNYYAPVHAIGCANDKERR